MHHLCQLPSQQKKLQLLSCFGSASTTLFSVLKIQQVLTPAEKHTHTHTHTLTQTQREMLCIPEAVCGGSEEKHLIPKQAHWRTMSALPSQVDPHNDSSKSAGSDFNMASGKQALQLHKMPL